MMLRFLVSGVLAFAFFALLTQLSPPLHPAVGGAFALPGTLIASLLIVTMPLDSLFSLVLSDGADGRDRFILAGYVCIWLFWWVAIFLGWSMILRRRRARRATLAHGRPATPGDTKRSGDQLVADGPDWPPKRWRYLLVAASAAVVLGIWIRHVVPQLYRAYETGVMRTGGGGRSGSYAYLRHQPDEFAFVVAVTVLFGLTCAAVLVWSLRRYRRTKAGPMQQSAS
jgi:hypothetical protein